MSSRSSFRSSGSTSANSIKKMKKVFLGTGLYKPCEVKDEDITPKSFLFNDYLRQKKEKCRMYAKIFRSGSMSELREFFKENSERTKLFRSNSVGELQNKIEKSSKEIYEKSRVFPHQKFTHISKNCRLVKEFNNFMLEEQFKKFRQNYIFHSAAKIKSTNKSLIESGVFRNYQNNVREMKKSLFSQKEWNDLKKKMQSKSAEFI